MILHLSKVQDGTLQALLSLADSNCAFYPCGSRYFGYYTPESDYDFFFERDIGICDFLIGLSFAESGVPSQYMDVNTLSIWTRGNVQVMEVASAACRIAIQEDIILSGERSPKGDKKWWNEKYCAAFPHLFTMPEEVDQSDKGVFA